jgi:hypothetical protein
MADFSEMPAPDSWWEAVMGLVLVIASGGGAGWAAFGRRLRGGAGGSAEDSDVRRLQDRILAMESAREQDIQQRAAARAAQENARRDSDIFALQQDAAELRATVEATAQDMASLLRKLGSPHV